MSISDNLDAFFKPSSIAVVGASLNPTSGGNRILQNLLTHFDGDIYAVNPRYDEILGVACYPTVAVIPGPVDLAVVFIPARQIPQVVHDCVAKGVRAVCIESGGFADAGATGDDLQQEIQALTRGTGTRLWGPNCAGYVSTRPPLSTSFVVTPGQLQPGNVALAAQSGMVAAALLVQILSQELFAVSKACSIGNKSDVGESDLLEDFADDPDTEVIAFYLESIDDGPRFAAALDRAIARAPVLVLMGGQTDAGAGVATSHTGSIAGEKTAINGLLRQHGALQVDDFMELADVAAALATLNQRSAGNRVAVLTFSGAAGVVSADLFTQHGLVLAELSDTTKDRLRGIYPQWLEPENPVDVWSTVELQGLERTIECSLEALLEDDGVDAVLFIPLAFDFHATADLGHFASIAQASHKPIVAWPFGEQDHLAKWQQLLRSSSIAACRSLKVAVRTLEAMARRHEARRRLPADAGAGRLADGDAPSTVPSNEACWSLLDAASGGILGEEHAKPIFAAYGLPVVDERRVSTTAEAVEAAEVVGYPVVLKLAARGLAHKTDLEGVACDLDQVDVVQRAAARLLQIGHEQALEDYHLLVQPMIGDGIETIVGARRDPRLGPLVVFGMGGVFVEQLQDVAVRPAPITTRDAHAMLGEIRAAPLLAGGRGRPPADTDALVSALLSMSNLITSAPPHVQEVEVNPFIVRPAGRGAVAVDALITLSPDTPEEK